ncbi:Uu.00g045070.m01.CDS01 [Anthostomella pinea]|uniref:Uu.00g045070.m01.CDS01 n=1 Tax=Anthostomella pinea TaxID=933095 RepID=A0AAI8VAZ8_9PEZI|nr:Uu.00g045070.m01.CDS01 [Anthostomella pinea]
MPRPSAKLRPAAPTSPSPPKKQSRNALGPVSGNVRVDKTYGTSKPKSASRSYGKTRSSSYAIAGDLPRSRAGQSRKVCYHIDYLRSPHVLMPLSKQTAKPSASSMALPSSSSTSDARPKPVRNPRAASTQSEKEVSSSPKETDSSEDVTTQEGPAPGGRSTVLDLPAASRPSVRVRGQSQERDEATTSIQPKRIARLQAPVPQPPRTHAETLGSRSEDAWMWQNSSSSNPQATESQPSSQDKRSVFVRSGNPSPSTPSDNDGQNPRVLLDAMPFATHGYFETSQQSLREVRSLRQARR